MAYGRLDRHRRWHEVTWRKRRPQARRDRAEEGPTASASAWLAPRPEAACPNSCLISESRCSALSPSVCLFSCDLLYHISSAVPGRGSSPAQPNVSGLGGLKPPKISKTSQKLRFLAVRSSRAGTLCGPKNACLAFRNSAVKTRCSALFQVLWVSWETHRGVFNSCSSDLPWEMRLTGAGLK